MSAETALVLDIVTSPVQVAALAGYLIYEVTEPIAKGVVGGAVCLVWPPSAQRAHYERKSASRLIRSNPSLVADGSFTAVGENGRPTPRTLAFAEALRDPEIRFPPDILEATVERLRAVPQAIPAFAPIFARPELDAAALERLRPTVEEWSRDWSRDCARQFARNPNLAPRSRAPPFRQAFRIAQRWRFSELLGCCQGAMWRSSFSSKAGIVSPGGVSASSPDMNCSVSR